MNLMPYLNLSAVFKSLNGIPPNVAYIGDYCFSGLIDEIHFAGVIPPTITSNTFSNINFSNTKITVSSSDYKTATYWSSILTYYDYFHYFQY